MAELTKRSVGRPSTYTQDVPAKVDEYLQTTGREQTSLPTREGFCNYINKSLETVWEWEQLHPELAEALKRIDRRQKQQLMDDGMYGGKEVNSSMAIFLLKANHGMIERSQLEIDQKVTHIIVTRGDTKIDGNVKIIDSETTQQLPTSQAESK